MKFITKPSVYLVGKQEIQNYDLDKFLDDHGVTWQSDSEVGSEVLIESAGRLCYMSYAKPRPGGNLAYIEHIKQVGHGSVIEHAVWNFIFTGISRSLSLELVRHRAGFSYCLAGDTIVHSGSKVNGRFNGVKRTWTMKELFEKTKTPHGRSRLKLMTVRCYDGEKFVTAKVKGICESGIKNLVSVKLIDGKTIRCSIDHRFLTPDGWKSVRDLSSGCVLATNGLKALNINSAWLNIRYNIDNATLDEIAEEVGCSKHTIRKYLRQYGIQKDIGKGMIGRTPWNTGKKYKAGWNHTEATKLLLKEAKIGELNPRWQGDLATSDAGRLRAQKKFPQQPCVDCGDLNGHRHHIDRNTLNNNIANIRFLCNKCHKILHNKEDGHSNILTVKWVAIESITEDAREMTYDLEVDHPAHNFVANGFVTHNSQLSQRYVDESDVDAVVPPDLQLEYDAYKLLSILRDDNSTIENIKKSDERFANLSNIEFIELTQIGRNWIEAIENSKNAYKYFSDYLSQKAEKQGLVKTEARKFARQAARSVLPNATETKIAVTVNARALRHFIELRGTRHAEPEIRILANSLLDIMQKESYALFGDYKKEKLPDGTFEITTEHKKI